MRSLLLFGVVVGVFIGVSHTAVANYFHPGRVIIGGGGIAPPPPPPTGGSTVNAAAFGCPLPVECECFKDTPLLDACFKSGVPAECIHPDTKYYGLQQPEAVLSEGKNKILGELRCTGLSNATAFVDIGEQAP